MTQTRKRTPAPKIMLRLDSRSSLADDLGVFGRTVGPRRGPQRRDTRQKEDYCLRRWLIAMAMMDRLSFPVLVEASTVGNESPDFLLTFGEGSALGVEITEAGSANWQQWLTLNEGMRRLYSGNGYVDREPEDIVIRDVIEALERKLRKLDRGRHAGACDLIIYENSEGGLMAERQAVMRAIRGVLQARRDRLGFRQLHLIFGEEVYLDLLGPKGPFIVDVSETHADDWTGWLAAQARLLRQRNFNAVDADNLAEELEELGRSDQRAIKSQIRRLLVHLLKCVSQPHKKTKSWENSIGSSRDEIESLLEENPSLENRLLEIVSQEFPRARRQAAREMNVGVERLSAECPFTIDQLRDPDYLPGR